MRSAPALELAPDVTAAARGDQQAFARLVDATASTVTSITLAILRDVEDSRDVAQEVYLMAWRDLHRVRDPTSFLPWLRQVTRNRAHQALRARVRHRRRHEIDAEPLLAAAADPRPGAAAQLIAAEEKVAVDRALAALPPSTREVVVLYYWEGRSTAQVALLLDLSEAAVRQRLSRARSRLRDILSDVLERTAPGTAFTAAVMAAIAPLAVPAAASAAVISAAGKTAPAGTGSVLLPGLAGAGGAGALSGLAGALAGVVWGTRELLHRARDGEERRGVLRVALLQIAGVVVFIVAIALWPTPAAATVGFGILASCLYIAHFVWLPRVVRRRLEAELEEDPVGASAEHRKRRRLAILGFAIGLLLGGGAILVVWLLL